MANIHFSLFSCASVPIRACSMLALVPISVAKLTATIAYTTWSLVSAAMNMALLTR